MDPEQQRRYDVRERADVTTPVGVVGVGYVGLTTAACLANLGHHVHAVDVDETKIADLCRGEVTLPEPGLGDLVREQVALGRLAFGTDISELAERDVVFVCVPTPMGAAGVADLRVVYGVTTALVAILQPGAILVNKSTTPVGTAARLAEMVSDAGIDVVSNPEFLRESHAVDDFLTPDRIVIGAKDRRAGDRVADLFRAIDAPVHRIDPESAELAKYASNAFLAVKLSFVNEIAALCENVGADVRDVAACMGLDPRIGPQFLLPGPGWGGSCLPKDTAALLNLAASARTRLDVVQACVAGNDAQAGRVLRKIRIAATGDADGSLRGARVGILGLAFKAGTADLRHSPALPIIAALVCEGAQLTVHDPLVDPELARRHSELAGVQVVTDPYLVGKDAVALAVLTEWPDYPALDWHQIGEVTQRRVVVDTRNVLDRKTLTRAGFTLYGNGIHPAATLSERPESRHPT